MASEGAGPSANTVERLVGLLGVELVGFRNLGALTLALSPRFNLFHGENAQGKTNLLEALSLLCDLQGFRQAPRQEMIAAGAERAVLRGKALMDGLDYEVALELSQAGRRLRINGKPQTSPKGYLGRVPYVSFTPEDVSLSKGAPEARRRFLDRALCLCDPAHGERLGEYRQWLKRRNQLLKDQRGKDPSFAIYGDKLAELGSAIRLARARFVDRLRPIVTERMADVSGGRDVLTLTYAAARPPLGTNDAEDVASLRAALDERLGLDLARGYTSVGPHVEDLSLKLDDREAQAYASQGQHRSLALSLKIAEIEVLRALRGVVPIFLIDDLSSELDAKRRGRLFDYLAHAGGQVLLTSTDRALPEGLSGAEALRFEVRDGLVNLEA